MKTIGIIAEYNPFHLGHKYQIDEIRKIEKDCKIITIITPTFTERGDISILNKWDKTRILLENNVDLVIEFPTFYATQSADKFAYGALKILNELKIDILYFGTETKNINTLINLANLQINNQNFDILVKKYLDSGINYPTSLSKALEDMTNIKVDKPNDLLAISYIKEIIKNKYNIEPKSILRTNDYHSTNKNEKIINASLIRSMIENNEDISSYIPNYNSNFYTIDNNLLFKMLKYIINLNILDYRNILLLNEGIENRIIKSINSSNSYEEFIKEIKTKRYTYNKVKRTMTHILLNTDKNLYEEEIYIRILGFNSIGRNYLNSIKKEVNLPIITNYKPNINKLLDYEIKATTIYSLIVDDNNLISYEYKNKPIIK